MIRRNQKFQGGAVVSETVIDTEAGTYTYLEHGEVVIHRTATEDEILSVTGPPAKTYKADIWRRATEQEAEVIEQMLAQQSARIRGLWYDTSYILHTDELFQLAWDNAVQAFGEERAGELLAPSEG